MERDTAKAIALSMSEMNRRRDLRRRVPYSESSQGAVYVLIIIVRRCTEDF